MHEGLTENVQVRARGWEIWARDDVIGHEFHMDVRGSSMISFPAEFPPTPDRHLFDRCARISFSSASKSSVDLCRTSPTVNQDAYKHLTLSISGLNDEDDRMFPSLRLQSCKTDVLGGKCRKRTGEAAPGGAGRARR